MQLQGAVKTLHGMHFATVTIYVAGEYEDMNRRELLLTISNLEKVGILLSSWL